MLAYSTYLGGSGGDSGSGIAVDASGNVYVTGVTLSADFPTTPGAFQTSSGGLENVFISKLNAAGTALLYSTYLGGFGAQGLAIAVDASGDAYVTGSASDFFPTTPGAFQTTDPGVNAAFVTKLNATGSELVYSTYLGGIELNNAGLGIAVDVMGNAYVTGWLECVGCSSPTFPVTPGAFQTTPSGGADAFVSKVNPTGSALVYSTYLGGSGGDIAQGIAVDASGNVYVDGYTSSSDFPTTHGAFQTTFVGSGYDPFVTKLNPAGSALVYSTYLGDLGVAFPGDTPTAVAVDASGNFYVTGFTTSPISPSPRVPSRPLSPPVFLASATVPLSAS